MKLFDLIFGRRVVEDASDGTIKDITEKAEEEAAQAERLKRLADAETKLAKARADRMREENRLANIRAGRRAG